VLATRIASALALGAIVITALIYFPPTAWALFCLVLLAIAGWEWGGLARLTGGARVVLALAVAAICWAVAVWTGLSVGAPVAERSRSVYAIGAVFWLIAVPIWLARAPVHSRWLIVGAGFLALTPMYLAVLELRHFGATLFLLVGAIVWIADIAAYFAGRRFGRHKLAPAISPGKTWEGVAGAVVGVTLYGLVLVGPLANAVASMPNLGLMPRAPFVIAAMVALTALAVMGDLFESALKRQAGVKDSGAIMPGHGGILDRLDAMFPVLPLATLGILLTMVTQ
jgi:phosphatidate cytidylyltransferase